MPPLLYLSLILGGSFRSKVAEWSNNGAMCAVTEKVIFTDPYTHSDMNKYTPGDLPTYLPL